MPKITNSNVTSGKITFLVVLGVLIIAIAASVFVITVGYLPLTNIQMDAPPSPTTCVADTVLQADGSCLPQE